MRGARFRTAVVCLRRVERLPARRALSRRAEFGVCLPRADICAEPHLSLSDGDPAESGIVGGRVVQSDAGQSGVDDSPRGGVRDHDRGVRFRGACGRAEARAGAVEGQENGCPEKGRRGGRRLRYGVRHAGKKIEKKERVKRTSRRELKN